MKCLLRLLPAVVLSERILDRVKMVSDLIIVISCVGLICDYLKCEIRSEIYGASDHCPLVIEIDLEAFS